MDINANLAKCIQESHNIGSTVMHNICNGTTQVVPWGSGDWVMALGMGGIIFFCFALMGTLLYHIATDR